MILYGFLALLGVATLATLTNWRHGIYWMILIGTLQDPVRKLVPGAPVYFVLATAPLWGAMVLGAIGARPGAITAFRSAYPRLNRTFGVFLLMLLPSAAISFFYGEGSWKVALLGAFFYMTPLLGFQLGYSLPRREGDLAGIARFYCLVSALALSGVLLEQTRVFPGWAALGTGAMGTLWIRHMPGVQVEMLSGFYRSPDVMGWHATTVALLAGALALASRGFRRVFWVSVCGWAGLGLMVCGRRKMIYMIPFCVAIVLWLQWRSRRGGHRVAGGLVTLAAAVLIGAFVLGQAGIGQEYNTYYFTTFGDVMERTYEHGYTATVYTIMNQAGVFGVGLGTSQLGARFLDAEKPRVWQEGGASKLAAEVGAFGLFAFAMLGLAIGRELLRLLQSLPMRQPRDYLAAVLGAAFLANALSFIVSGHVYNDPFINSFFSMLGGLALSWRRFAAEDAPQGWTHLAAPLEPRDWRSPAPAERGV